jgi:hypothetical protein
MSVRYRIAMDILSERCGGWASSFCKPRALQLQRTTVNNFINNSPYFKMHSTGASLLFLKESYVTSVSPYGFAYYLERIIISF